MRWKPVKVISAAGAWARFVLIALALDVNLIIHALSRTEKEEAMVNPLLPGPICAMDSQPVRGKQVLGLWTWDLASIGRSRSLLGPNGAGKTTFSSRPLPTGLNGLSTGSRHLWSGAGESPQMKQAMSSKVP